MARAAVASIAVIRFQASSQSNSALHFNNLQHDRISTDTLSRNREAFGTDDLVMEGHRIISGGRFKGNDENNVRITSKY